MIDRFPDLNRPDLAFYGEVLDHLARYGTPFLVGGAYAYQHYTGIHRNTRDFDVFIRPEDVNATLDRLERDGFSIERTFTHWLAKVLHPEAFYVDVIYNSGNGLSPVDSGWLDHATEARVLDRPARLCPIEEMIWTKAFVMERERFDGADVLHLIHAAAERLDWDRLIQRFGPYRRVLTAHLVLFGFVYPGERNRIPQRVREALRDALNDPLPENHGPPTCLGTLLSRGQYLPDLEWGHRDGRLPPTGTLTVAEIAPWTEAANEPPCGHGGPAD